MVNDWMDILRKKRDEEENEILHAYHEYMSFDHKTQEDLLAQWDQYFQDVYTNSPYAKLYRHTKSFFSMSDDGVKKAVEDMKAYLFRLSAKYVRIQKPSSYDPRFLLVKYGEIMSRRNLSHYIQKKKEQKNDTKIQDIKDTLF